jgi:hypothetical protein
MSSLHSCTARLRGQGEQGRLVYAPVKQFSGIGSGSIESLKWLALIVMLGEHWMRYVVGELPPWVYACGRVVFPLFVLSFALGLRAAPSPKLRAVLVRMLAWAVIAQATLQFVDGPERQLNVLFSFALGLAAAWGFEQARSPFLLALGLTGIAVAAIWCEFGPVGVALTAATIALARADDTPAAGWVIVAGLLAALVVPNGNYWALAAVPVAWVVWRFGIRVPRIRGAFYWAYALQFPVLAAAKRLIDSSA